MNWVANRARYESIVAKIEPATILVTKDHWIWPTIWWVATILTFGLFALGMPRKHFLEQCATTLFPVQGYPGSWSTLSMRLLVHECRHTTHCVWLGYVVPLLGWIPGRTGRRIRAWCGAPFYTVLYLLFAFPTVFAVGRWLIELDADRAAWKWQIEHGHKAGEIFERAEAFAATVCSGRYLWAWLKPLGGVSLYLWVARRVVCRGQT